MCRLAAYLGPQVSLEHFLLSPDHGLMEQSWAPKEMRGAIINADGYGFGWYSGQRVANTYVNPMPIWSDVNLESLGRSLYSSLWLANVRSATQPLSVSASNTMPFLHGNLLFMHNGFIDYFAGSLRGRFRQELDPKIDAGITGNTDSEYLFALLRHILNRNNDISLEQAAIQTCNKVQEWADQTKTLLNMIISDGQQIIAIRHAINGQCPSLYINTDEPRYPGGILIASEATTHAKSWQAITEHSLLVIDADGSYRSQSL
ncbi:MAG TPA: ergothioneine biosynthesis protein EgtC [Acidiferrobacteraceae bacterium]|nr:ergothioneine biosynthesis protein EgtC [Acidiferrobacteraceae bacterium]